MFSPLMLVDLSTLGTLVVFLSLIFVENLRSSAIVLSKAFAKSIKESGKRACDGSSENGMYFSLSFGIGSTFSKIGKSPSDTQRLQKKFLEHIWYCHCINQLFGIKIQNVTVIVCEEF